MNSSVYLTAHLSDIWKIELIHFLKGTPTWKSHLHLAVLCLLLLQIALKKIRLEGNKGNLLCFVGCVRRGFDSTGRELFALFISTELNAAPKRFLQCLPQGLQGKSYTGEILAKQRCRRMGTRAGEGMHLGLEEWTPLFGVFPPAYNCPGESRANKGRFHAAPSKSVENSFGRFSRLN